LGNEIPIEVNLTKKMWTTMGETLRIEVEYGILNHCTVFDSQTRFEGSIQGNEFSGTVIQDGTGEGSFLLKKKYKKVKSFESHIKNILTMGGR
jgi:hypothetical protein